MKPASMYYGTLLITRKVFFYGLLTIIPYYWFVPGFPSFEVIFSPEIIWSILILSGMYLCSRTSATSSEKRL